MSYKKILIGENYEFTDWKNIVKNIKKNNIVIADFNSDSLVELINNLNVVYILPLSNIDYNIIKNKNINDKIILYPNLQTYDLLNNKLSFTKFMMENFSHMIPDVYYLDNQKIKDIEFPVIKKPIYSTNGNEMKIYYNKDDFNQCDNKIIIQKFIDDEYEYGGYLMCVSGIIINWKIIRHKYKKYNIKTSNFPKNYENIENFDIEIFKELICKINYTGAACINFKFNESNNKIDIFEINPRFGGSAFSNNFFYELVSIE